MSAGRGISQNMDNNVEKSHLSLFQQPRVPRVPKVGAWDALLAPPLAIVKFCMALSYATHMQMLIGPVNIILKNCQAS